MTSSPDGPLVNRYNFVLNRYVQLVKSTRTVDITAQKYNSTGLPLKRKLADLEIEAVQIFFQLQLILVRILAQQVS